MLSCIYNVKISQLSSSYYCTLKEYVSSIIIYLYVHDVILLNITYYIVYSIYNHTL